MNIARPDYDVVTVAKALRWPAKRGVLIEEKLDGRWHVRRTPFALLVGELMPDKRFIAFDCIKVSGQPIAGEPLSFRLNVLDELTREHGLLRPARGAGGEFLAAILAHGGEGIVAKDLSAPFGYGWTKAKRRETHDCVVTSIGPGESISITEHGIDRGRCPVSGGKLIDGWDYRPRINALHVGDVVEVRCHSIHASGKFREARFVRVRNDKVKP